MFLDAWLLNRAFFYKCLYGTVRLNWQLQDLELSHNGLTGTVAILATLTRLRTLLLDHNTQLGGLLPPSLSSLRSGDTDFSDTQITLCGAFNASQVAALYRLSDWALLFAAMCSTVYGQVEDRTVLGPATGPR